MIRTARLELSLSVHPGLLRASGCGLVGREEGSEKEMKSNC
jgi:hypothetical protein